MESDQKLLVFVTHGPAAPQRCATPFYMASVACAMDSAATLVFQIDGVLLMRKGVAEDLRALEGGKLIIDFIREAKEAGVEFYCCSAALQLHGMTEADLIPECNGVVGAAWMMEQANEATVVLSY
jgi:predicted peroxiredoxin